MDALEKEKYLRSRPSRAWQSEQFARINGEAGIVSYADGRAFSVLTLDRFEGRIQGVYIVTNPEKLSRLPGLPPPPE